MAGLTEPNNKQCVIVDKAGYLQDLKGLKKHWFQFPQIKTSEGVSKGVKNLFYKGLEYFF